MKGYRLIIVLAVTVCAFVAFGANAQTLTTTVSVFPSIGLTFSDGTTPITTGFSFGQWAANGTAYNGSGKTYPGTVSRDYTSGTLTIYAPLQVTATGANTGAYTLQISGAAVTSTATLAGTGTPQMVYAASGVPATAVPSSPAYIAGSSSTWQALTSGVDNQTINVGFQIPSTKYNNAGGSFDLSSSLTFTATAQ